MAQKPKEKNMNDITIGLTSDLAPVDLLDGASGFEGMDASCISIPFLRVAQPGSDEVKPGTPKFMDNLKMGQFFSPTTRQVYGNSVRLVILKFYRAFTKYTGEGMDSKFMGTITPDEFEKIKTTRIRSYAVDSEGHRYVDTRNFLVLNYDKMEDGPMLLSLSSTGISPSKKWMTMAASVKVNKDGKLVQAPAWSSVWLLNTAMFNSDLGSYYQIATIERLGWVPKELAPEIKRTFDDMQSIGTTSINMNDGDHDDEPVNVTPHGESAQVVASVFGPKAQATNTQDDFFVNGQPKF